MWCFYYLNSDRHLVYRKKICLSLAASESSPGVVNVCLTYVVDNRRIVWDIPVIFDVSSRYRNIIFVCGNRKKFSSRVSWWLYNEKREIVGDGVIRCKKGIVGRWGWEGRRSGGRESLYLVTWLLPGGSGGGCGFLPCTRQGQCIPHVVTSPCFANPSATLVSFKCRSASDSLSRMASTPGYIFHPPFAAELTGQPALGSSDFTPTREWHEKRDLGGSFLLYET